MAGDPSLNDEQLEDEIRLVGDLVLAASQHQGRLSQDEVDEILGLQPARGGDDDAATGTEPSPGTSTEHGAA
jgi:hypothetical protein